MASELCVRTCYSFLQSAITPADAVQRADELGYQHLAITDEASVAGCVRAFEAAKTRAIHLIYGSRFLTSDGFCLIALAADLAGWSALCSTISLARRRAPKGQYDIALAQLPDHPGLRWILLPSSCPAARADDLANTLAPVRQHFCGPLHLAAIHHRTDACDRWLGAIDALSFVWDCPVIATSDPHLLTRSQKPLHDILTAIRHNTPLHELGERLAANAEATLRPLEELRQIYPGAWLNAADQLAQQCRFDMSDIKYRYPSELVPPSYPDATTYLRDLTYQGAHERWGQDPPASVQALLEKELSLIQQLAYEPYFLTVHDVVQFARSQGILCQGRGSAANSAVCYCLHITEVDPARVSVLFERFISAERNEPPDIDVDFEHHRREEVIQYLYRRYGRERAALAATVITYRPKSAIRDVGRALGMDEGLLSKLSKSLSWWAKADSMEAYWHDQGIDASSPRFQLFLKYVKAIQGLPRHLSQHVGGFIIADGPLSQYVPVENAAMADRTIIQWDKDDIETLGLLKLDVLALGMLSAIRRTLDLARSWRRQIPDYGGDIDGRFRLQDIPPEDPATYERLCQGDSLGVFQVESRAQMSMLPRLKPRCYYDLVIQVAIVRPGPIQGDMVHPYLRRRAGEEAVDYPSSEVKNVLERTLGVPIFQEQVIELVMVAAGFSAGEADQVRRSMAAWQRKGGMGHLEQRITEGMLARGYEAEFAARVFQQIQGFSKYGFPESHAASFALLVYVSAWLKCHVPEAFYTALLNSYPMGFYSPSQILQDAKRHGIAILPIDINRSDYDYALQMHENKTAIRVGFRAIKKLPESEVVAILMARQQGPFQDMADLAARSRLSGPILERLAAAGALDDLAGHRQAARWSIADSAWQLPLLADSGWFENDDSPMPASPEGSQVVEDYRQLGFSLRTHRLPYCVIVQKPKTRETADKLPMTPGSNTFS